MCAIIMIISFGFAVQNLIAQNWLTGAVQLIIAIAFLLLLLNNIQQVKARRDGTCYNGCRVTNWVKGLFKR
jgi:hypothetical protein